MPDDLGEQLQDPKAPELFFLATGVIFGCLALGLILAARWLLGKRLPDLVGRWRWSVVGAGALVWTVALAAAALLDWLIVPEAFSFRAGSGTAQLALYAVIGLAPQVFAEEIIFRGFVTQGVFLALRRDLPAAVVSGVLFGALHLSNGAPHAVSATIFGVLTSLLAIRLGGIALPFGIHLANNLFGAVVLVSAQDVFRNSPGLFLQDSPQMMWWDVIVTNILLLIVTLVALRGRRPAARIHKVGIARRLSREQP